MERHHIEICFFVDEGVDLVFLWLSCLHDVINALLDAGVTVLRGFLQGVEFCVQGFKFAWGSKCFDIVARSKEDLSLCDSDFEWNITLSGEIVLLDSGLEESLGFSLNLIEVSKVSLTECICLWEPNLSLDFIWHEW